MMFNATQWLAQRHPGMLKQARGGPLLRGGGSAAMKELARATQQFEAAKRQYAHDKGSVPRMGTLLGIGAGGATALTSWLRHIAKPEYQHYVSNAWKKHGWKGAIPKAIGNKAALAAVLLPFLGYGAGKLFGAGMQRPRQYKGLVSGLKDPLTWQTPSEWYHGPGADK